MVDGARMREREGSGQTDRAGPRGPGYFHSKSCVKLYIGSVSITVKAYQDLTTNYLWNKLLCYHGGK